MSAEKQPGISLIGVLHAGAWHGLRAMDAPGHRDCQLHGGDPRHSAALSSHGWQSAPGYCCSPPSRRSTRWQSDTAYPEMLLDS
jgi:hypothetical protein